MDEKKIQICSEIYCLLKYFPEAYIYKLPKKLLNLIKENSYSKYFIEVDVNKTLEEQNIIKETKDTLVVLKYNYWSNETEKRNIIEKLNENEKKYEEELREKFNPNKLFKNKVKKIENSVDIVEYKESFFSKIRNLFKRNFY